MGIADRCEKPSAKKGFGGGLGCEPSLGDNLVVKAMAYTS
jgi:hypothetical protein